MINFSLGEKRLLCISASTRLLGIDQIFYISGKNKSQDWVLCLSLYQPDTLCRKNEDRFLIQHEGVASLSSNMLLSNFLKSDPSRRHSLALESFFFVAFLVTILFSHDCVPRLHIFTFNPSMKTDVCFIGTALCLAWSSESSFFQTFTFRHLQDIKCTCLFCILLQLCL